MVLAPIASEGNILNNTLLPFNSAPNKIEAYITITLESYMHKEL